MNDLTPDFIQPQLPSEEWRDIPGYEGLYQVSDQGQVRRLEQRITTKRGHMQTHRAKDKAIGFKNGYCYLWLFKDNQGRKYYVHELVALTFIGPRPSQYEVHHKNEIRTDNRSDNLEYRQEGEHARHHHQGEKGSASTITDADVRTIRVLYKTMAVYAIAKHLNLSYHIVWQVSHGKTWKHVI